MKIKLFIKFHAKSIRKNFLYGAFYKNAIGSGEKNKFLIQYFQCVL